MVCKNLGNQGSIGCLDFYKPSFTLKLLLESVIDREPYYGGCLSTQEENKGSLVLKTALAIFL